MCFVSLHFLFFKDKLTTKNNKHLLSATEMGAIIPTFVMAKRLEEHFFYI